MSQQQRYDVSPKWAILVGLGAIGIVAGIALTFAGLL